MLSKELLDRLICSKYLFRKGQERLFSNSFYSSGEAILLFQDSVEMALRVIAEHLGCSVRTNTSFEGLIEKINGKAIVKVPNSSALIRLNKSRVGFKHHGLSPLPKDVSKFSSDLESFFPQVCTDYLNVEFTSVSLADVVRHFRTRNYLKKAEEFHNKQDFRDSVIASSKAFHIFLSNIKSRKFGFPQRLSGYFLGDNPADSQWKTKVEQVIDEHQDLLDLLLQGVDLVDYQKFVALTPNVAMFNNGTFQVTPRGFRAMPVHGIDESLFCCRFVLESVMVAERNRSVFHDDLTENLPDLSVTEVTEVIVFPCDQPEVICSLNPGDKVKLFSKEIPKDHEFIKIRFQGDFAYIKRSSVYEVENTEAK